ncbi:MAG: chromate resistance protein [Planctomycetota bacterium]|nr:MAG: chromate resistance protein [Planctomycetota bacterium]
MKAMLLTILILTAIALVAFLLKDSQIPPENAKTITTDHIYISWDIMEFDKCVAAWLIKRFIDKDAKFRFVPSDTEITEGTPFDVPGANWSRKHRKCTSQCILESIDKPDPAIEQIVTIASRTELNFWQLDRWPDTQKYFYEVKQIMDQTHNLNRCIEKTNIYFDKLYTNLKKISSKSHY